MERRFISSTDHMPLSKSIKDNADDDNESDGHDVEDDEFDEDDEEDENDKVTQESKAAQTHMVVLNIGSSVVAQDDESIVEDDVDTKGIDENATGNGKLDSSTEKRAKFAKPSEAKAKIDKGEDNEFDVDDEFDEGDEVTQQCKAPYTSMVVPESGSLIVAQDDESVDEAGVNTKDIELVMSQVDDVTRAEAIKALKAASGDVVEAIMKLTEQPNHYHLPGASSGSNTQLPPPLLPPPPQLYGSGGPGLVQPGSMVDGARIANNPIREAALKCPRCESTNTKFCYYNNYSLSQPHYYCKTCRRYWTRGGALASAGLGGSGDAGDGADSSLLSMAGLERWRSRHWRFPVLGGLDSSSSSGLYTFNGGAEQSEPIKDKAKDDEGEDNESDAADVEDDEFDEEDDEFNEDDKEDDYEEVAQQLKAPHSSMVVSKTRSSIVAQDDESVDEAGVNTKDVEFVMLQSGATRSKAIKALKAAAGDIVEAIMELLELDSTTKEQNPSVPSRRSFGFWDVDYPLRPSYTLWDKEKGGGDVEEPVKDKAKDEDEEDKESDLDDTEDDDARDEHDEDDESVDEAGVITKDVELVMSQALATRSMAIKALKDAAGDVVEAIIQLTQVDSTTMKQYPSDKHKPSSGIRLNWGNYHMAVPLFGSKIKDEKDKGGEDAEAGSKSEKHNKDPMTEALVAIGNEPDDLVSEGRFRGRKTRRAGSRRTRAKLAVCERRKTVQPTPLLTGLNNHPSIYIRLGQRPPDRNHYVIQDTWTRAFELCSNAAEVYKKLLRKAGFGDFLRIQPFRIRSGGYMSALVERYFSESHTLHLGTFEIGPTPLAWSVITGIRFAGTALNPPDITPQECAKLLEFKCIKGVFFKDKLKLDVLCPKSLDFRRNPNDSDLEWMFRRLIVFLVGSCFFSGTDLMVPISLVSAMNNIQNINQYDWGSATFSAFLRGMRQKTSECCGTFSGFYPFLLLWAYEHIPYMRPSTDLTAYIFPVARRWNLANKEVPNSQNDFIWHRLELEYLEEDQVNFDPFKNFPNKAEFPIEIALSQKRIAFWGLESWEVYMGERNLRQFGLSKRIPQAPPEKRFGETDVTMNNAPKELMHGINARTLLQDEEHNYEEWFRANSLGRIVAVDQLQGKQMLGVRLVELWFRVHRDGYKILSPQDLQTLEDTKTEKHLTLKNKLKETLAESKTLKKDLDHLNAVVMSLNEERDFWRKQAFDAYDRVSALEANFSQMGLATNLVPYPTQTSLFHPDEMLPFTHGYMNNYYG